MALPCSGDTIQVPYRALVMVMPLPYYLRSIPEWMDIPGCLGLLWLNGNISRG